MGFVSRQNVVASNVGAYAYIRSQKLPKILRGYEPAILTGFYHQFSTKNLIEANVSLIPIGLNFQSGATFQGSITHAYQNLTEPFSPLGVKIEQGRYDYTRFGATFSSNQSKKIACRLSYETGNFYNGKLHTTDVQLSIVPIPHIALKFRYFDNQFKNVGISATNNQITLMNVEGRLALNPRVQLIGLYQYNTQHKFNAYNLRFSWEYQPLSFLYLIWNSRVFNQVESGRVLRNSDEAMFAKVSFLKQF